MKKMLLFLTALAAWHGVAAQDVILLRNADEIKARVTEITETDVLCKIWDDPAKMLRIARAEVFSITYANGERELFAEEKSAAADYPWPAVTRSYRPGDLFDEDGVRGVVISTTDEGRHGLILSLGAGQAGVGRNNEAGQPAARTFRPCRRLEQPPQGDGVDRRNRTDMGRFPGFRMV